MGRMRHTKAFLERHKKKSEPTKGSLEDSECQRERWLLIGATAAVLRQLLMKIMRRSHGAGNCGKDRRSRSTSRRPAATWKEAGLSSFEELDSFCLAAMRPIGNTLRFIILQRQGR